MVKWIKSIHASPVPLILIGNQWLGQARIAGKSELYMMTPVGVLADVAPTVLTLFGLPVPEEMTGKSLV